VWCLDHGSGLRVRVQGCCRSEGTPCFIRTKGQRGEFACSLLTALMRSRLSRPEVGSVHLEMKVRCEKCAAVLTADGQAFVCSYECTFCAGCAVSSHNVCPHCGGELVRRPQRKNMTAIADNRVGRRFNKHTLLVWGLSFGVWTFIALVASISAYRFQGSSMSLMKALSMEFSQLLPFAPLTPFAFAFALRRPLQPGNWMRLALLHLVGGVLFTVGHVALRGMTPYGAWDGQVHDWVSAVAVSQGHLLIRWPVFETMFFYNLVDDISSVYVPIVVVAQAVSYHQRFRERDLRASQLEGQLAKAHLHALKGQLQPHFLFNTLHSISALMLTDVIAADRMMSRLSDLLRMSLEGSSAQMTTLNHELEFANGYLEIEKIRFEDRLTVVLDIAPDTLDAQVPHLLLQPLVENAVRHGIARLSSGGEIRISANHYAGTLHLQVRDNGPGLAEHGEVQSKDGLGVGATRERLRTLYGDDQQIEIRNATQGGVEVNVRIPFCPDPRPSLYEVASFGNGNGLGEKPHDHSLNSHGHRG
jgi:two-component system LytT family sensor kinase